MMMFSSTKTMMLFIVTACNALLLFSSSVIVVVDAETTTESTMEVPTPVEEDPLSDWSICSQITSHVYAHQYNSDPMVDGKCTCAIKPFVAFFEVDCDLACDQCQGDDTNPDCIGRKDTFRFYVDRLRDGKTPDVAYEGKYARRFFKSGPLSLNYEEIRIGHLEDGTCETFLSDLLDEYTGNPCTCEFVNCNGTPQIAMDCTAYYGTTHKFGYCDTSQNTIELTAMDTNTPLIALNEHIYSFHQCFSNTDTASEEMDNIV